MNRGILRRISLLVLALGISILGSLPGAGPARAAAFVDIGGSIFQREIEWLAAEGITGGCGDGRFCPTRAVNRAEMASFLVRMFGYTAQPAGDPFTDDNASIHEDSINRLVAAGITSGCAPGRFCPASPVQRGQMASFLSRALGLTFGAGSDHFNDDDRSVHETNLDRMYFAGIGGSCATERACPTASVTREQMAAFLYRSVHASPIGAPGLAEQVTFPAPIQIAFAGPARFRGVGFSADGTTASHVASLGTIVDRGGLADRAAVFNGVRYVRMAQGSLAGSWVKVDGSGSVARGRSPRPPACTYADALTSRQSLDQYATTLLDTTYRLRSDYVPADLVSTGNAGINGGYSVRSLIIPDLRAMADAARAAGAPIQAVSGYRSYDQQAATFAYWVSVGGYEEALRTSARAGHSEHQLGTTIDVTSLGGSPPWSYNDWATTKAGAWIAANAWRYGFLVSYPRNSFAATCYDYEPWHLRYVGRPTAAAVHDAGLTLREAIWAAFGP